MRLIEVSVRAFDGESAAAAYGVGLGVRGGDEW